MQTTICNHTMLATGITAYLENDGTIENAQAIVAYESPRTTKLYDRRSDQISLTDFDLGAYRLCCLYLDNTDDTSL